MTATAASTLRVPITNVHAGGDYTAQITIGSNKKGVDVIMDTGSSTLAVVPSAYDPKSDTGMQSTPLAQDVIYGTGGWTGPVLETTVAMGVGAQSVSVNACVAVTTDDEAGAFGQAGGILGLAYNVLNSAYNLTEYLTEQRIHPAVTYPWPFQVGASGAAIQQFGTFLNRMPQEDLPPYFTALETVGISKNTFAFYTLRSVPSMRSSDMATDPLNNGFFILGGGQEESGLYTGEFISVDVVDDQWYNTDLISVQVGDGRPVPVAALPQKYAKTMISNSIVDSGTNSLALTNQVFTAIVSGFERLGSTFATAIQTAGKEGAVPTDSLQLENWPDITFTLQGESGEPVALSCSPSTYWQVDAPKAGDAIFMISGSPMLQSILGLPLLNNYYAVFDRSQDPYGAIRFAPIAAPSAS